MNTKSIAISIILVSVLIGGAIVLNSGGRAATGNSMTSDQGNVFTVDGMQVIEIGAKGRYSPQNTIAKAGTPTVLKIKTNGTFDCTSALTIPSLNYRANLPPSGETLIEVPPQQAGATLKGLCAMGMYSFEVSFN